MSTVQTGGVSIGWRRKGIDLCMVTCVFIIFRMPIIKITMCFFVSLLLCFSGAAVAKGPTDSNAVLKELAKVESLCDKRQYQKADLLLDKIKEYELAQECLPQMICHTIRYLEGRISNESGSFKSSRRLSGVVMEVIYGPTYILFTVQKGRKMTSCTSDPGTVFKGKGDIAVGRRVTVFMKDEFIDDCKAVRVILYGSPKKVNR